MENGDVSCSTVGFLIPKKKISKTFETTAAAASAAAIVAASSSEVVSLA
jgi:hypothetical protein